MNNSLDIYKISLPVIRKVFLTSFPILITAVISGVLSSLTNFLLAKIFNPVDFAIFRTIISTFGFLSFLLDFGVSVTLTRYIAIYHSQKDKGKIKDLIFKVLKFKLAILAIVSIILLLLKNDFAKYFLHNEAVGYLALLGGLYFIFVFFDITKSILTGFSKFKLLSFYNVILPAYGLGFSIILAIYFRIEGVIIANSLAYFGTLLFLLWFLLKNRVFKPKKKNVDFKKILISFSFPIYLANLPSNLSLATIPLIALFFKPEVVGLFAFSMIFYNAFTLLPQSIYHVLLPQMSAHYSRLELIKISETLKSTIFLFLFISIPIFLIFLIFIRPVVRLFLPGYLGSIMAIDILSAFAILTGISTIYTASLNAQARLKQSALISYVTTFLLIVVSFIAANSIS
ncbi:MAG TPA: oligosaccharide flippase family protein [Patescibacteria group bacterium]